MCVSSNTAYKWISTELKMQSTLYIGTKKQKNGTWRPCRQCKVFKQLFTVNKMHLENNMTSEQDIAPTVSPDGLNVVWESPGGRRWGFCSSRNTDSRFLVKVTTPATAAVSWQTKKNTLAGPQNATDRPKVTTHSTPPIKTGSSVINPQNVLIITHFNC